MRFLKILSLTAFALSAATGAFANDADFKLKNRTGYRINEVYVSAHDAKRWGRDIMGKGTLRDGETLNITFPHGNGACMFDIKVKYADGDVGEFNDVNLCRYSVISLYWDRKNQTTRAVGE